MNKFILNTGVQKFINKNINTDIMSILLKKTIFDSISSKELAEQIESKNQCKKKLPTWFETLQIYYPKKINIEQTSSEVAAQYKSEIVSGKSLIDLTGGFGVDCYFFSRKIDIVFHCEINPEVAEIAAHNFNILGAKNITTISGDGLQYLKESRDTIDWIFIDPSRRSDSKGKVFNLSDCLPDVTLHFDLMFASANNILIKTAPFLDISAGIKELKQTKTIHIVSIKGEVKELLWVLEKDYVGDIQIKTVNIINDSRQIFNFFLHEEKEANSSFELPLNYLYEPNASIMKSGAFKVIGNRYGIAKIHKHTHLYSSEDLFDFPGRRFIIKECLSYDKTANSFLKGLKANISTRNFPKTVAEIKKKYKMKDGGEIYLFFITDINDKLRVLNCEKIH